MPRKEEILKRKQEAINNYNSVLSARYEKYKDDVWAEVYQIPEYNLSKVRKEYENKYMNEFETIEKFCGHGMLKRSENVSNLSFDDFFATMKMKNMVFSKIPVQQNDLLTAMYNLIQHDEDNIIYNVIKNMKRPERLMDTRLAFYACFVAFEDKKDLPQEVKQSLDFLKQVDSKIEAYSKLNAFTALVINRDNDLDEDYELKKAIEASLKTNKADKEKRAERERLESQKVLETEELNNIVAAEEAERKAYYASVKNHKEGDPVEIKLFVKDFVDLMNKIHSRGFFESGLSALNVAKHVQSLKTNEERLDYFQQILNMGQHARAWEYSPEFRNDNVIPKTNRNCGNLDELKEYYYRNQEKMSIGTKAIFLKRMHAIELASKLSENKAMPDNKLYHLDANKNVTVDIRHKKTQTSGNGCWSVAMQAMLKCEGIEVDQEDIRGYKSDYDNEARDDSKLDDSFNNDMGNDIGEQADKILAFAPNRMLRTFELPQPGEAQIILGPENKINLDEYIFNASLAAAAKIRQVLNDEKTVLSFTNGMHYYSIIGIDDFGQVECIDSGGLETTTHSLEDVIRGCFTGKTAFNGQPTDFRLTWLTKMELGDDNTILNAPSHYMGVNEDGTYKLPPKHAFDEFNSKKTKMEKNGFRVTMTGGVDDTEYDRLNRNPLQEGTNLLIKEHAYLPNKFDLDVLKKRRAERDPKYTQLLTQRREELLGKDFIAPDYSKLTDDQMAAEVDKRTRSRINHETVYELKEFAGLNNVPDYEKRDFEGKEYLYNKPGAVVAYRFYKTYQGLKQLYTHMCQVTNNHKDWTTKLDFIEKEYAKFMKRIEDPKNEIKDESVSEVYPLKGYLKSDEEIAETAKALYNMGDQIPLIDKPKMQNFGMKYTYRVYSMFQRKATEKYDPTVISMFAENLKEFAREDVKTNHLKEASRSEKYSKTVDVLTTMPTQDTKILGTKFTAADQYTQTYLYFCRDATRVIYLNKPDHVGTLFDRFSQAAQAKEMFDVVPDARKIIVPEQPKSIYKDIEIKEVENPEVDEDGFELLRDEEPKVDKKVEEEADDKDDSFNLFDDDEPKKEKEDEKEPEKEPEVEPKNEIKIENEPKVEIKVETKPEVEEKIEDEPKVEEEKKPEVESKKEDEVKHPNVITRALKRRDQYRDYYNKISNGFMLDEDKNRISPLKELMDYLSPYLEPGTELTMSYDELKQVTEKYKAILVDMEKEEVNVYKNDDSYKKFRQVMSKDLRTFNSVLNKDANLSEEEKNNKKYNISDIYEQSRSIRIEIDEKAIQKTGGNLSERLHIVTVGPDKKPIDGYFTKHEPPFDYEQSNWDLAKKVAGTEDPEVIAFAKFILQDYGDDSQRNSYVKNAQRKADENGDLHKIHFYYGKPSTCFNTFKNALKDDLNEYIYHKDLSEDSETYKKLEKFIGRFTKDYDTMDELLGHLRSSFLIKMKKGINNSQGINNESKIDKRNSAMSAIAEMLGIDYVIAKSSNMRLKVGNETYKGTYMEKAKGVTYSEFTLDKAVANVTQNNMDKSPELIKCIADLQVLDLICGNTDRHPGNFSFITEEVENENGEKELRLVAIQGIDNDTSFGKEYKDIDEQRMACTPYSRMLVINEETAKKVLDLDEDMVRAVLVGFDLSRDEIQATIDRLKDLKSNIEISQKHYENGKNKELPPQEGLLMPLNAEDRKNMAISNGLHRDKVGDKDYNVFSRVFDIFAIQNGVDNLANKASEIILYGAKNVQYGIRANMEMLDGINTNLQELKGTELFDSEEFDAMTDSFLALVEAYDASKKDTFKLENGEMTFNDNLLGMHDMAKEAVDNAKAFIEMLEEELKDIDEEDEAYEPYTKQLQNAKKCLKYAENIQKGYKSCSDLVSDYKKLQVKKAERAKAVNPQVVPEIKPEVVQPEIKSEPRPEPEKKDETQSVHEEEEKEKTQSVHEEEKHVTQSEDDMDEIKSEHEDEKKDDIKSEHKDEKSEDSESESDEENKEEIKSVHKKEDKPKYIVDDEYEEQEFDNIKIIEGEDGKFQIIKEEKPYVSPYADLMNEIQQMPPLENVEEDIKREEQYSPEERQDAVNVVKDVLTLKEYYNSMYTTLNSYRVKLRMNCRKYPDRPIEGYPFDKDGTPKYNKMVRTLDETMEALKDHRTYKSPGEIYDQLKKLENAVNDYHKNRYGLTGRPFWNYGRNRLDFAEQFGQVLPLLMLTVNRLQSKINSVEGLGLAENSVQNMVLAADKMIAKYNIRNHESEARPAHEVEQISREQVKAYATMKKLDIDMYNNFSATRPNEAMIGATTIEERAKRFVISNHVNGMLKSDISLNDIQAKLEFFNENNVKREAERLAKDPSFVAVQNACMKKTPDRGISAWKHVEEITDQLHSRIGRQIDEIGNVGEFLQLAGQRYNPVNNTKDARQHSLRNVCKKVSGLLVKQALYSDEGREILHLMALDGNANRINTLEEFTTNYLMDKKVFEPSKNHNIFDKLTSKFNHELAQDILKAYKKTGPRPEKVNVIQNENNRNKNLNNQIENKNNIVMGK